MDIKSAWIYCSINAPEDTHGILKGQYERLETYASQMGFIVVGSSQDLGSSLHLNRPGLQSVLEAAKNESFQVLLVDSVNRIGLDEATIKAFIKKLISYCVTVFSPLEGKNLGLE
ncbi:recombinase family protein [Clostridium sp. WB02_MRS01]|uniref:recombinase family protein n=1 Tax=Clostridium sp. WB02_MRS01 TaxID=2605777 RepID=UPI0012B2813C|nr:recombinase family protein [Clostridium sp. WB02_MRS01]MSS10922.1 recombinase family protein [Clostridium sp. WB02_MRS01]